MNFSFAKIAPQRRGEYPCFNIKPTSCRNLNIVAANAALKRTGRRLPPLKLWR